MKANPVCHPGAIISSLFIGVGRSAISLPQLSYSNESEETKKSTSSKTEEKKKSFKMKEKM